MTQNKQRIVIMLWQNIDVSHTWTLLRGITPNNDWNIELFFLWKQGDFPCICIGIVIYHSIFEDMLQSIVNHSFINIYCMHQLVLSYSKTKLWMSSFFYWLIFDGKHSSIKTELLLQFKCINSPENYIIFPTA